MPLRSHWETNGYVHGEYTHNPLSDFQEVARQAFSATKTNQRKGHELQMSLLSTPTLHLWFQLIKVLPHFKSPVGRSFLESRKGRPGIDYLLTFSAFLDLNICHNETVNYTLGSTRESVGNKSCQFHDVVRSVPSSGVSSHRLIRQNWLPVIYDLRDSTWCLCA